MSDYSLSLILSSEEKKFTVGLKESPPSLHQDSIDEYIESEYSLCENGWYKGVLKFENPPKNIKNIEILLNDESIGKTDICDKNLSCPISFKDKNKPQQFLTKAQPFLLHYDLIILAVRFELHENDPIVFYSRYIVCASKEKIDTENAKKMLEELLEFSDSKVCRWIFPKNAPTDFPHSLLQWNWNPQSFKSVFTYIQMVESVTRCYQSNFPYFHVSAKHQIKKKSSLRSYENVRSINASGFTWLMQNTEQFVTVPIKTGICHQNKYYLPMRIKTDESVTDRNVYENRIILGFIVRVLKKVKAIYRELYSEIDNEEVILRRIQGVLQEGYGIPIVSVKQVRLKHEHQLISRLGKSIHQLESLQDKYCEVLKCPEDTFTVLPRKTKTFQEVAPYNEIFAKIVMWHKFGELSLIKNNVIFRIKKLDKLFEYYCLFHLLQLFSSNGFIESQDVLEASESYSYSAESEDYYIPEIDVANTFHLERNKVQVTLYYQPVIYNNKFENDISLFRTTGRSHNFYTPDFLLKIVCQGTSPKYIVFDAKYSILKTIIHSDYGQINDALLKYSCQLASKDDRLPVASIIILQGRVDASSVYEYHNSKMSKEYPPLIQYKVIPINTVADFNHDLWNTISPYLK